MRTYYVYILSNWNNRVLYVGVTNDLRKRMYEHKNKLIKGFTQKYNVTKLVYCESFTNVNDAISAEKKVKGWIRFKKKSLIESVNQNWNDLSLSL